MSVTRSADAVVHEMHGFRFASVATPSRGTRALAVWTVAAPAGSESPCHTMSEEEVLVVQAGRVVAHVGDEHWELRPGDGVVVPAGEPFQLRNPYDEDAALLACTSAGMRATVGDTVLTPPWGE